MSADRHWLKVSAHVETTSSERWADLDNYLKTCISELASSLQYMSLTYSHMCELKFSMCVCVCVCVISDSRYIECGNGFSVHCGRQHTRACLSGK